MDKNIHIAAIEDNYRFLKDHLKNRIPIVSRELANRNHKDKDIDLETFTKVLKELKLPDKYFNDDVLRHIQKQFPSVNEGKINHGDFFTFILENKDRNDFFAFKDVLL